MTTQNVSNPPKESPSENAPTSKWSSYWYKITSFLALVSFVFSSVSLFVGNLEKLHESIDRRVLGNRKIESEEVKDALSRAKRELNDLIEGGDKLESEYGKLAEKKGVERVFSTWLMATHVLDFYKDFLNQQNRFLLETRQKQMAGFLKIEGKEVKLAVPETVVAERFKGPDPAILAAIAEWKKFKLITTKFVEMADNYSTNEATFADVESEYNKMKAAFRNTRGEAGQAPSLLRRFEELFDKIEKLERSRR